MTADHLLGILALTFAYWLGVYITEQNIQWQQFHTSIEKLRLASNDLLVLRGPMTQKMIDSLGASLKESGINRPIFHIDTYQDLETLPENLMRNYGWKKEE